MDTGTQIKAYLESSGISQKYISDKTSIPPRQVESCIKRQASPYLRGVQFNLLGAGGQC